MISAILKDSVFESTVTTGTGAVSLAGAQVGHSTFRARFPDQAWVGYVIELRTLDGSGAVTAIAREVGVGKLTYGAPDTLSRDYVLSSTNADALVNFAAGTKDVFCAPGAALFGWNLADVSSITAGQTLNVTHNGRLLLGSASGGAFTQNLPAVAGVPVGYRIGIMKTDSGANAITIDGNSSETINSFTTIKLTELHDMVVLVNTGSAWHIENNSVGGRLRSRQVYTSGATWTKPVGLKFVVVTVVAGGGGGGAGPQTAAGEHSGGEGGGAGGASIKRILQSALGGTETVTVGAGGTGVAGADGNAGGTSSFGAHCSATGGSGGQALAAGNTTTGDVTNTNGGTGSSGDINIKGGDGMNYFRIGGSLIFSGAGGASMFGGGGGNMIRVSAGQDTGKAAAAIGSGGGGAAKGPSSAVAAPGGDGADGIAIVEEYF